MNKHVLAVAVGAALLGTGVASAAPFNSFDPRSMAMGGAGAAVGNTATAPFFNPSLLSITQQDDDFAIELPIVGARAYDPDEFMDSVDNFQNDTSIVVNDELVVNTSVNNVDQAFTNLNSLDRANYPSDAAYVDAVKAAAAAAAAALGTTTAQGSGTLAGDTKALSNGFKTISDRGLNAELGVGTVIGIPSKNFGGALVMNSWNVGSAIIRYKDEALLTGVADDTATFGTQLGQVASCSTPAECEAALTPPTGLNYITEENGQLVLGFDPDTDIKSSVEVRGISLNEVGVALSREFTIGGQKIALGVTPKYVKATTLDYVADVNSADQGDVETDDYTNETTNFNLDVGAAKDFANGWRAGMVIKNIIAQKYDLMRVDETHPTTKQKYGEIELNPQARAGVSYQNSWFTGGLDLDLTENDAVGFEDKTRYAAMGVELNALDWAQLRLGYRADMVNSDRSVASAGIGLSPFGVHFDLAVAANANELGASAQFGFRF